jgi:CubicO group peptidase (beta-lactamase class C family)
MLRRRFFERSALATIVASDVAAASHGQASEDARDAASLDEALRPYLARSGLPALAAAVVREGRIIAAGAVGTRRAGAEVPVTLQDRFHIGSDTKAMTALLAAMMVEQGRLRWDSTLGESFAEFAPGMDAGLRRVTLEQLLSHSGGIPSDNEAFIKLVGESFSAGGQDNLNLDELRAWLVRQWSTRQPQPLAAEPGTRFAYSNLGYTMAGAMVERAAGRTWEELMVERVFEPLGLASAGLGPQARRGRVDAPLGHVAPDDAQARPKAMLAGPDGDAPAIIGPAGVAHLSVHDFARWAGWNAGEGRRGPALVRPETLRRLHTRRIDMPSRPDAAPGTPKEGGYALGWGVVSLPYATEPFLWHAGSNTMNLALIAVQPTRDFAMVMATNIGGRKAEEALTALAGEIYGRFGPAPVR